MFSLFSSTFLFKPFPKTSGFPIQIVKGDRKNSILWERESGLHVLIQVFMFILRALFFVFACAHRFACWNRTRNREINHYALILTRSFINFLLGRGRAQSTLLCLPRIKYWVMSCQNDSIALTYLWTLIGHFARVVLGLSGMFLSFVTMFWYSQVSLQ